MSRPGLSHYLREPGALHAAAAELFALVAAGTLRIEIARTYPLHDAAQGAPRRGGPDPRRLRGARAVRGGWVVRRERGRRFRPEIGRPVAGVCVPETDEGATP